MEKAITIKYTEFSSIDQMSQSDRGLLDCAILAAEGAYAPYSHFKVGAALRLLNGDIVCGNNQENAAYPSGLCAERTALFAAASQNTADNAIVALAIVGINADGHKCEASPCGACRQVMAEYENRQNKPIRVICYTANGGARVFDSTKDLLPFSFEF